MGFMDQLKAAANDLKDSVEGSLSSTNAARDAERLYRDLGMLTYLQETGRSIDPGDRQRMLDGLEAAEAAGSIAAFTLVTGPPPAPAAGPPPAPAAGPPPAPAAEPPVPPPPSAPAPRSDAPTAEAPPPPAPPGDDVPPPPPPTHG